MDNEVIKIEVGSLPELRPNQFWQRQAALSTQDGQGLFISSGVDVYWKALVNLPSGQYEYEELAGVIMASPNDLVSFNL